MKTCQIFRYFSSLSLVPLLAACGGSPPPAATSPAAPAAAKTEAPAPRPVVSESAQKAEAAAASSDAPAPAPADEKKSEDAAPRPSRPPIDTITAAKLAFVLNYGSSAPNESAEKKCSSMEDPQARARCLQKERGEFTADVLQFTKDKKEKLFWVIYRRKGWLLTELSRIPIQLEQTANTVTVKIASNDRRARALFPGQNQFVISVPNDYSIEMDDPRFGKLVYDAKIDVVGKSD